MRPPSARAALQRTSVSGLLKAATCDAKPSSDFTSAAESTVHALLIERHLASTPSTMAAAISSTGHTCPGAAIFHEFTRHAPDHRGGFRLGDGASAMFETARHRIRAVAPHPGHQHSDQTRRRHKVPMRWSPSARRWDARDSRVGPEPASRSRPTTDVHDEIGVAPADIDHAGLQRHRPIDLDHAQFAYAIEALRERTGEARRHMLRHQHRPGKSLGQLREARYQARRVRRSKCRSGPTRTTGLPLFVDAFFGREGRRDRPLPGIDAGCAL